MPLVGGNDSEQSVQPLDILHRLNLKLVKKIIYRYVDRPNSIQVIVRELVHCIYPPKFLRE